MKIHLWNLLERDMIFIYMKTKIVHYSLSVITIILIIVGIIANTPNPELKFGIYLEYAPFIASGFLWTVIISIIIFILSFVFGFLMFFAQRSKIPYIRYLTNHFTNFMFGSPMLVIVIVFYFFVGTAFHNDNELLLGIIGLTLYFAPFMMKLYISAYESIDKNQIIVSDLFGFSKIQMYRYIIFPQMIRIMLPPLSGNLATIIKSSSLLYLIGFNELYYNLTTIQAKNYTFTEGYIIMLVLYLVITIPLLKLTAYLEKSVKI